MADPFRSVSLPLLGDIPFLGPVLFRHDVLIYLSWLLVLALWFFLTRTRAGLYLQAIGENPGAADSLGISVFSLRYFYVIVGGMLCGAGGAYLSLASAPSWLENMTAGRGWIAVALVIFALWKPGRALVGSYLFGGIDALGFHLQAGEQAGAGDPSRLLQCGVHALQCAAYLNEHEREQIHDFYQYDAQIAVNIEYRAVKAEIVDEEFVDKACIR